MEDLERITSMTSPSSLAEHDNRTHTRKPLRDKRIEFAIFLKVLLRCLEISEQKSVERQSRLVVLACIRGLSRGDPSFYPLEDAIEYQLKRLVDERTWDKAKWYIQYYLGIRGRRQVIVHVAPNPFIQFVLPTKVNRDCLELGAIRMEHI
jgi:hypothetical protein